MQKVCFIGLGIMGKPMARNLIKAGYSLQVYDIVPSSVEELATAGAKGCSSIKEAVEGCDTIITMLPNSPHVKSVVLGEGGVADNAKRGALFIDMSSIAPSASKEIHDELAKRESNDRCTVSGGEPKLLTAPWLLWLVEIRKILTKLWIYSMLWEAQQYL